MQVAPGKPQLLRRLIDQLCDFGFDLVRLAPSVVLVATSTGKARPPARILASRSVVDWRRHTLAGSAMR
jgi:hypothetical protein